MGENNKITRKNFQIQSKWLMRLSSLLLLVLSVILIVLVRVTFELSRMGDEISVSITALLMMSMMLITLTMPLILYIVFVSRMYYKSDIVGKALRDPLTGSFNRNYFDEFYLEQVRLFHRFGHDFSVATLDIDHFKEVNDQFGHDIGDMVLKELVQHLRQYIRSSDILARLGGEEFIILFPGISINEAIKVSEIVRLSIEARDDFSCGRLTVSLGVASMSQVKDGDNTVLKKADMCLYRAKGNGRNQVVPASNNL